MISSPIPYRLRRQLQLDSGNLSLATHGENNTLTLLFLQITGRPGNVRQCGRSLLRLREPPVRVFGSAAKEGRDARTEIRDHCIKKGIIMLLLHEIHEVVGRREDEFETAFREGWLPALAETDDARLLHFLHHAHGTGVAYNVVTITWIRDAAAWAKLVDRVHVGDLSTWAAEVDQLRHEVTAKLMSPLPWSPVQDLDVSAIPTTGVDREPEVYMEDTVWPYEGMLDAYIERSGAHYAREMRERKAENVAILEVEASYRTVFGTGRRREIVLWQRVTNKRALSPLVSRDVPEQYKQPGGWMHDALEVRDRWESKLLRSARWSPVP